MRVLVRLSGLTLLVCSIARVGMCDGSISGTVIDEVTQLPIDQIGLVFLYDSAGSLLYYEMYTGPTYETVTLPSGTYYLKIWVSAPYFQEVYSDHQCPCGCDPTDGTPVVVGSGNVPGVDFELGRGGWITGTITDAQTGQGVLSDFRLYTSDGSPCETGGLLSVDGFYETLGLPGGTYFVATDATDHRNELYDDIPCDPSCDVTDGDPVAVVLGQGTWGIDFALEPVFRYVALGDSYSSGEGCRHYFPFSDVPFGNQCHRSSFAYSQVTWAIDLTADDFFACSGAVTDNIFPASAGGEGQYDEPPQLDHPEIASADLVTVTIGGNDVLFADVLTWCYDEPDCRTFRPRGWSMTLEEYMPQLVGIMGARMEHTVARIRAEAPGAFVVVLGYPVPFPEDAVNQQCGILADPIGHNRSWTPAEQNWIRDLAPELNAMIRRSARRAGGEYARVDMEGLFPGHEVCGPMGSWFVPPRLRRTLNKSEFFHPDRDGHLRGYRRALESFLVAHGLGVAEARGRTRTPTSAELQELAARVARLESAVPTVGDLGIEIISPPCQDEVAVPGQQLRLTGDGFSPGAAVQIYLEEDSSHLLATASADGIGDIDELVALPAALPATPLVRLEAAGTGANGHPRLVLAHVGVAEPLTVDSDTDGIPDACDLCPDVADPGQGDVDSDGIGDLCDPCPDDSGNDTDGDGACDSVDPCPYDPDDDGDSDGLCAAQDNCPYVSNPGQGDSDGDLFGDACDACPGGPDGLCLFYDGFESGDSSEWSTAIP